MPDASSRSLIGLPEFRALVVARATNALAMSALTTVVAFQVYDLTRDPLSLGWLGLVEAIPALSLVLFGGHLADRRERRGIVLATSALVTVCAIALAAQAVLGATLLGILAVIFANGVGSGFERPALTALEAGVVPRDQAVRGVSVLGTVSQSGAIIGPAAGGIAIVLIGIPLTYVVIAALLGASTLSIATIAPKPVPAPVAGEPFVRSLLGGIRYVRRTPALVGSMALDLFAVFFGGAIALLPVFATDVLHVGSIGLGVLRTAPSIGALLAMVAASRRPPTHHAGRILLASVAGFGLSMIVFGASTLFAVSLVALFLSGVTDGVSMVIRNTILRVLSPERIRGRVASVNWVFIGASNELGAFESGVAARLFGTVPSVVGGGFLTLAIVGVTALVVPALRDLDLATAGPGDDGLDAVEDVAAAIDGLDTAR
ncbi:MAG TPA: MFS transporter [Candidatus Limnocylindrales bacterium]|nr:MFS transporter [Candidatus Limnocylindrales bacterium]